MHDEYTILFDIHAIIHFTVYKFCKLRQSVLCPSYTYLYLDISGPHQFRFQPLLSRGILLNPSKLSLFFFFSQPLISSTHVPFQLSTFSHPSLSFPLFFSFFSSSIPYPSIAVFHQFHQHVWHDCCLRQGSLPSYVILLQEEDSGCSMDMANISFFSVIAAGPYVSCIAYLPANLP